MCDMSVTFLTFHELSDRLNAVASWNILAMFATLPTFHGETSWLNTDAPWNMLAAFVTLDMSHVVTEVSLKEDAL